MKLELKHLAAYYAHNLKVQYYDDERGGMRICEIVELRKDECTISDNEYQYEVEFYEFMPILRPLSDLIKPEHILGIGFRTMSYDLTMPSFTIKQFEYLFKNHFDVFDLIEQGLAIDINTLTNEN